MSRRAARAGLTVCMSAMRRSNSCWSTFHARAEALQRLLPTGQRRLVSGKVELFDGIAQMVHPDHVCGPRRQRSFPAYEPVYPLTAGLTQRLVAKAAGGGADPAAHVAGVDRPGPLKAREGWPDWATALKLAHAPEGPATLAFTHPARQRLAYDELFAHQLTLAIARSRIRRGKGTVTRGDWSFAGQGIGKPALCNQPVPRSEPWPRSIDMAQPLANEPAFAGRCGRGQDLGGLPGAADCGRSRWQGVMMAPTEILARQHFEGLAPLARAAGVRLELLTGRDRGADRAMKLEDLAGADPIAGRHPCGLPEGC